MKCPNCGAEGSLIFQELHQAAYEQRVLKNGKLSKRRIYKRIGSIDVQLVACTKCCANWWNQDTDTVFEIIDDKVVFTEEID